jgi:hypothetical protein
MNTTSPARFRFVRMNRAFIGCLLGQKNS